MPTFIELKDDCSEKVHYDYSDYPIYIHRAFLSQYPNYTAPNHWHDDIELIAVLSGEMKYYVNGEIINLQCGDGIFVNARQMHFGFSDTKSECDFICVLLHPRLLCFTHSSEQDFVLPLIHNNEAAFVVLHKEISWQREIFNQIQLMHRNKNTKTAPMKTQAAFSTIWSLLYENVPRANNKEYPQSPDLTIIKNMVGFIQRNYNKKINIADIARSGAVGQSKCCKLFGKYFSQTPNMYLTQYRLNKSIELLRHTDMSITEIALSVGFSGASYYAETFRKFIGKSPSAFRNHNKKRTVL